MSNTKKGNTRPTQSINELTILQQGDHLLIDARLLHKKLRSKQEFSHWIKARIRDYGLEENTDFLLDKNITQNGRGGHNKIDYLLTIDTAKELAMLEKNEIGRAIRRYFIQKEKEARGQSHLPAERELFKGLRAKTINGARLYPYRQLLVNIGYSPKSTGYHYRRGYANHFVQVGPDWYVTEALGTMIYHSRRLAATRKANKATQAVLPFNNAPEQLSQGGKA